MNVIFMIDFLSAQMASMCFWAVMAKSITKRLKGKRMDAILMKLHRPAGYLTVLFATVHMACSLKAMGETAIWAYLFGMLSFFSMILAIIMFKKKSRNPKCWLLWHRVFSVIAMIAIGLHLVCR